MADGDVLKIVAGHQAFGAGGSGGVTVDNTVDPPFAASTIIAPGATESAPDEATLPDGNVGLPSVLASDNETGAQQITNTDDDGISSAWLSAGAVTLSRATFSPSAVRQVLLSDTQIEIRTYGPGSQKHSSIQFDDSNHSIRLESLQHLFGEDFGTASVVISAGGVELSFYDENEARVAQFRVANGGIATEGLPTADPMVAGFLWVDVSAGRVVKVSAG